MICVSSVSLFIDGYSCGQEGSPAAVCIAADLEKNPTEDALSQYHCEEDAQGFPISFNL